MVLIEQIRIKKILLKVLCLIVLCFFFINIKESYSYDTDQHDKILNIVLFGDEYSSFANDKNNIMKAINSASYLCVDQYNNSGNDKINFLRNVVGVKNIILSIDEINFSSNYSHRKFTHSGWRHKYTHTKIPNSDIFEDVNWDKRKRILLETCKKVFDFGFSPIGYDKKCDAFSSMIYYIHLIGDYQNMSESEYEKYKLNSNKHQYMIPLYKNNDRDNIINDIEDNFKTLFSTQKEDNNYRNLLSPTISDIKSIKNRLNLESSYLEFKSICNDLIDVLQNNVPELLNKEEFFSKKFYR